MYIQGNEKNAKIFRLVKIPTILLLNETQSENKFSGNLHSARRQNITTKTTPQGNICLAAKLRKGFADNYHILRRGKLLGTKLLKLSTVWIKEQVRSNQSYSYE